MLTRLKVSGFKNLVDVDVSFGPFTCIAGANGVGKSNLFDAIRFLSALADRPLLEAAAAIRSEGGRGGDIRGLFHRVGDRYDDTMSFEAEMIVPAEGEDDLGQHITAGATFLRYSLVLAYRADDGFRERLEILHEELGSIKKSDARRSIRFDHDRAWFDSVIINRKRNSKLISTGRTGASRVILSHYESNSGRAQGYMAAGLPRTVLSVVDTTRHPTVMLARREMQSWRLLQLEPSTLRRTDSFSSPQRLGSDGAHLPAMLLRLSRMEYPGDIYSTIANRLASLIEDVRQISVDVDEGRQSLTLMVRDGNGTFYPGHSLSDGTLRFLALAALVLDPEETGVLCLEEPENGIHPARISAILQLLGDIAVDTSEPVSEMNPLRQIIINTHSPSVVAQVDDDSLLVAELKEKVEDGRRFSVASFGCLPGTWRASTERSTNVIPRGILIDYLNPAGYSSGERKKNGHSGSHDPEQSGTRVMDREDVRRMFSSTGE